MPLPFRSSRRYLLPLVCVVFLSAGCPGDETPSPGGRSEGAGTLRLAYPEEPGSLNPILARSPAARDILRAVLPSFHVVTPDLRYRAYLLASEPTVKTTGDGMEVQFRLRKDARWSDGRLITVDDVAFTWQVMTDPELPVAVRDGFEYIVDVSKRSPSTGTLVLSPPYAGWRDLFSAGRFVLPKPVTGTASSVETWDEGPPVAGGPFRIEKWTRGRAIVLRRNPRFFGTTPLLEELHVEFVPDSTTALQLLQAGEVDAAAPALGISWGRRLEAIPGVITSGEFGPDLVHLIVNTPSSADAGKRRRIAEAIDRDRFAEAIIRDEGRKADGVLAPEQHGAVPAWDQFGTNAQPSEHLSPNEELTLAFPKGELLDLAARYVQAEVKRAGGDVELVPLDGDVFHGEWLPERRFDLALWEGRSGPDAWLSRWFAATGDERVSQLIDGELDQSLTEAEQGVSRNQAALELAQERLAELVPVLPLFQPKVTIGWREGVRGIVANPTVDGPLWNAWNWSIGPAEA
jgi:peptide/nickel transport system substrate-binding protein